MATMQITKVGYERIIDVLNKGLKLKVASWKVGDALDYVPDKNQTALRGTVLSEGIPASCDAITDEVLDFVCIVDTHIGSPYTIGEVGLFLDTGELFAIGVYPYPESKAPDTRFIVHALVLAPYITAAIDLTLNWHMSLPRVNYYGELPNPERTGDNAYVVNHGIFKNDETTMPALVTRYALTNQGPLAWGLLNGTLYYDGPIDPNTVTVNTFDLALQPSSSIPKIRLECAFVYVYQGTGRTQCRAIRYNPTIQKFETLYEDFSLLVSSSSTPVQSTACDILNGPTQPITSINLDATSRILIFVLPHMETTGLIYKGRWKISDGLPDDPEPFPGSYWVISEGGIMGGVCYQPNDWLVYNDTGVWDKIDNTELPYMLYKGDWDASTGAFPPAQPIVHSWDNLRQGHYWVISVAGTISGISYDVNDWLVWNGVYWDKRRCDHALTAERWRTPRTITATSDASGTVTIDGSGDVQFPLTVHTADQLRVARKINLTGDANGYIFFDGSSDENLDVIVTHAIRADTSAWADNAQFAADAGHASAADYATNAATAGNAIKSDFADFAKDTATFAGRDYNQFIEEILNYIPKITFAGGTYYDSGTDNVGVSLKLEFGGQVAYVPSANVTSGVPCSPCSPCSPVSCGQGCGTDWM